VLVPFSARLFKEQQIVKIYPDRAVSVEKNVPASDEPRIQDSGGNRHVTKGGQLRIAKSLKGVRRWSQDRR